MSELEKLSHSWAKEINRRATVEQWMLDAAAGKKAMPTPEELKDWALKLGTPREYWRGSQEDDGTGLSELIKESPDHGQIERMVKRPDTWRKVTALVDKQTDLLMRMDTFARPHRCTYSWWREAVNERH